MSDIIPKEVVKKVAMDNYQGRNLFVKNIHETVDSERLRQEFSRFGEITSARVMYDWNGHKGFGFVCFSRREEAARALREMNHVILVSKPLYVALHQKKEERQAHLASQREIMAARRSQEQPMLMVMPSIIPQFMPQQYFLQQPVWPTHPVIGGAPPPAEENQAVGMPQVPRETTRETIPRGGNKACLRTSAKLQG